MSGEATAQYPRLNQVLAIEKGIKERAAKTATEAYHAAQKPNLFNGFIKRYRKINESGETYPDQAQKVQKTATEELTSVVAAQIELLDITATKDYANQEARADIVVDGTVVISQAPATFILWLEKQVENLRTYVTSLPTLSESEDWTFDGNISQYRSAEISTHRTAKVIEPLVLYPATDKHPAQTQLINKDVTVGYWDETKLSGALSVPRKAEILARIEKLYRAVKIAREAANMTDAPRQDVGKALLASLIA